MRKSTTYHYSEGDVKKIIQDELNIAKKEIISAVTQNVDDSFTKKITQFKDDIFIMLDKVMGELKSLREEVGVITGYKDQIEDHETRIEKIETILTPQ